MADDGIDFKPEGDGIDFQPEQPASFGTQMSDAAKDIGGMFAGAVGHLMDTGARLGQTLPVHGEWGTPTTEYGAPGSYTERLTRPFQHAPEPDLPDIKEQIRRQRSAEFHKKVDPVVSRALDTPGAQTALEAGGAALQDVGTLLGAAALPEQAASLAARVTPAGEVSTIKNFGQPEPTAPSKPAGYTREDFAPKAPPSAAPAQPAAPVAPGKPRARVNPQTGQLEPAPAAPAAPTPPTAPETPSAAPDHAGRPAPDVHDPEFFPAPDNQGVKSAAVGEKEQAHRQAAVERGAPTLPQVRDSAITNSYEDQGRDWTGRQAGKTAAVAQTAAESQALHSEAGRISQETGGQLGTGESADTIRGKAYQDWHDSTVEALNKHIDQAYAEEDAAAKQVATPASNLRGVLANDSLIDSQNASHVRSSTIALARNMGVDLADPNAQLNAWQVEQLRKHAGSIYGNAPRLAQAIKDAADADLPPGAYVRARALTKVKKGLFDNRDGINQLGASKDIDPETGKPRPENRPVKAAAVMGKIENMDPGQVKHIMDTMKRSSTLLSRLGDEPAAQAITDKAHRAAQHIQSHFTERWAEEASKGGGWNQRRAHQFLRNNQETLSSVMSPEQMHRIRNVNNAANVLDLDKGYKGAFAQFATGASWLRQRLGRTAEGALSDMVPPGLNTIGELTGVSERIRQGLAGKGKDQPANFTRPLGATIRGGRERGAVGHLNAPGVVHDYNESTGHHEVQSPNGVTHAFDHPNGKDIVIDNTKTEPVGQGSGEGTLRMRKLADAAIARGGRLLSDSSVSSDQQHVYSALTKAGYKVEKNPAARSSSNAWGQSILQADKGDHVFAVSKPVLSRPQAPRENIPLGMRPGFRRQAGAVGDLGKARAAAAKAQREYQAPKELEDFIHKQAPTHHVDEKGPTNWEELQQHKGADSLPINPQESEGSIYSNQKTNIAFRAWHDKTHLDLNAGFDHPGELRVALEHQRQAREAGLSEEARRALWADTWETFKHHEDTGEFPKNPREFVGERMKQRFPGDPGEQGAKVNIGLHVNGGPGAGGDVLDARNVKAALKAQGVKVGKTSIQNPPGGEPTLVADIDRPLTENEGQALARKTGQTSIAMRHEDGSGHMFVQPSKQAEAAQQGWDKFNPDYFQMHDGRVATEHDAEEKAYNEVKQHLTPQERADIEDRADTHRASAVKNLLDTFHGSTSIEGTSAMALAGKAKKGWYENAAKAINGVFGPDAPRFTALLAAMSPQTSVEMNFHNALRTFVNWDKAGRPVEPGAIKKIMEDSSLKNPESESESNVMDAWHQNGVRALTSKDPEHEQFQLSGPKVDSFYKNLRGHAHEVTNDSWNAIAMNIDQKLFSGAYRKVANDIFGRLGFKSPTYMGVSAKIRASALQLSKLTGETWTPREVQETMWSFVKTAFEHAKATGKSIPELVKSGELNDQLIRGTSDFHSLFSAPEHKGFLDESRFGKAAQRMVAKQERSAARRPDTGEASAAAAETLRPNLLTESERLESARQARLANKKARIGNIQVPF